MQAPGSLLPRVPRRRATCRQPQSGSSQALYFLKLEQRLLKAPSSIPRVSGAGWRNQQVRQQRQCLVLQVQQALTSFGTVTFRGK